MATFSIESNGRLEKTALYHNGEQISGIKELFLNLDEDGTFDAIIQYEDTDGKIRSKALFENYLDKVKVTEPSFTEEEARLLQLFTIESSGDIEDTVLFLNDEAIDGVVSVYLHIKTVKAEASGFLSKFKNKPTSSSMEFKAEITYRNDDDSLETEDIF
jgi:hypothetical protein